MGLLHQTFKLLVVDMASKKIKKPAKHRIHYDSWINSQLSIAKFYGGCTLNGKEYRLDYDNCKRVGDKYFPDFVEV